MNPSTLSAPSGASTKSGLPRLVWGVGGLMAAAIVALAGTVVYQRSQMPSAEVAAIPEAAAPSAAMAMDAGAAASAPLEVAAAPAEVVEPAVKPVASTKHTPKPAKSTPAPANAPATQVASSHDATQNEVPPAPPAPQICATCGVVESVETVTVEGKGSGAGAVAGGVAGAVIGNQFGKGGGRTAARLLGAVGGAFAGNAIEKHARTETVYKVHVRMDDGSRRTFTEKQPPAVGAAVTVDGSAMRLAH